MFQASAMALVDRPMHRLVVSGDRSSARSGVTSETCRELGRMARPSGRMAWSSTMSTWACAWVAVS